MFELIVLLKPDFNSYDSFALSWVDKVTKGTWSFVYIILNFVAPVTEEIVQTSYQVKMRLISQLVNGISGVLQKLLQGTLIKILKFSFMF